MQRYIGIDLGGTNIKGALVSETGKILKQRSVNTDLSQFILDYPNLCSFHVFKQISQDCRFPSS